MDGNHQSLRCCAVRIAVIITDILENFLGELTKQSNDFAVLSTETPFAKKKGQSKRQRQLQERSPQNDMKTCCPCVGLDELEEETFPEDDVCFLEEEKEHVMFEEQRRPFGKMRRTKPRRKGSVSPMYMEECFTAPRQSIYEECIENRMCQPPEAHLCPPATNPCPAQNIQPAISRYSQEKTFTRGPLALDELNAQVAQRQRLIEMQDANWRMEIAYGGDATFNAQTPPPPRANFSAYGGYGPPLEYSAPSGFSSIVGDNNQLGYVCSAPNEFSAIVGQPGFNSAPDFNSLCGCVSGMPNSQRGSNTQEGYHVGPFDSMRPYNNSGSYYDPVSLNRQETLNTTLLPINQRSFHTSGGQFNISSSNNEILNKTIDVTINGIENIMESWEKAIDTSKQPDPEDDDEKCRILAAKLLNKNQRLEELRNGIEGLLQQLQVVLFHSSPDNHNKLEKCLNNFIRRLNGLETSKKCPNCCSCGSSFPESTPEKSPSFMYKAMPLGYFDNNKTETINTGM